MARPPLAVAAITAVAHSRYQGCTIGESATRTSSARPRARTGSMRPVVACQARRAISARATSSPRFCTAALTGSGSVPAVSRRSSPSPRPRSLLRDSAVWMRAATLCVPSQPKPVPPRNVTPTTTPPATSPGARSPFATLRTAGPLAARPTRTPTNSSATAAGDLTIMASPMTADPVIHLPRRASSTPASMRPVISPSLWTPPTTWMSSSGFIAPSHSAVLSPRPCSRARLRRAQTISTSDPRAIRRIPSTAGTMVPPLAQATPRARRRKNGPYGAGVSVQCPPTLAAASPPGPPGSRTDGPTL